MNLRRRARLLAAAASGAADIIAAGNPLEDIAVLEHVTFVMKGGVIVRPADSTGGVSNGSALPALPAGS